MIKVRDLNMQSKKRKSNEKETPDIKEQNQVILRRVTTLTHRLSHSPSSDKASLVLVIML